MSSANLQQVMRNGFVNTADNTKYRVHLNGSYAVGNVAGFGVGVTSSASVYLAWKLKSVKRLKGTKATDNLTTGVTADGDRWGVVSNSAANKKF